MQLDVVPKILEELTGRRPPTSTWRRWILAGVNGKNGRVKLRSVKVGGRIFTSREYAQEFLEATNKICLDRPTPESASSTAATLYLDKELD